jgi:hypothetical protein
MNVLKNGVCEVGLLFLEEHDWISNAVYSTWDEKLHTSVPYWLVCELGEWYSVEQSL